MQRRIHSVHHVRQAAIGLLFLGLMVAGIGPAQAQETLGRNTSSARDAVPPEVQAAANLLFWAYPELLVRRVAITVNPHDGFLAISVTDVVDGALARQEVAPVPLFTAEIALNAAGEMTAFGARGPFLEQARNEALGNAVLEHPEWSEADAWRFMLSLGGRDTTAAAPIGTLNLADGPTLLGTRAVVHDDAALSRNASASADKASVSKLGWTTRLRTTTEKGTAAQFKLTFEPFGGRLIQVTRE